MTTIQAIIKGRRLELDVPADWPDGLQVEIHPLGESVNGGGATIPIDRDAWLRFIEKTAGSITDPTFQRDVDAMSSEEIARTLAAMDRVVPIDITDAEQAEWDAARKARQDREKTHFAEHAEELRRGWE